MLQANRWALLAILVWGAAARANETLSKSAMFDRPLGQQTIAATQGTPPTDALTCTYYADFMVRETGTDTPGPGPAYLVPVRQGGRPSCAAVAGEHAVKLKTDGYGLEGRKNGFLFFSSVGDYRAAFLVVHAPDGRTLYADDVREQNLDDVRDVSVSGDVLHLAYVRGVNATCSLPKGGAGCWATILKAGHFNRAVASQPAPVAACAAAYRAGKVPVDQHSIITYDVEMQLTADGKASVLKRGALQCEAVID